MLVSVLLVDSGKRRKTNKSTWEVITVTFFSHLTGNTFFAEAESPKTKLKIVGVYTKIRTNS